MANLAAEQRRPAPAQHVGGQGRPALASPSVPRQMHPYMARRRLPCLQRLILVRESISTTEDGDRVRPLHALPAVCGVVAHPSIPLFQPDAGFRGHGDLRQPETASPEYPRGCPRLIFQQEAEHQADPRP